MTYFPYKGNYIELKAGMVLKSGTNYPIVEVFDDKVSLEGSCFNFDYSFLCMSSDCYKIITYLLTVDGVLIDHTYYTLQDVIDTIQALGCVAPINLKGNDTFTYNNRLFKIEEKLI